MSLNIEPIDAETGLPVFELRVRAFIAEKTPHVVILTPCYGGTCHVNYVHALIQTVGLFRTLGITLDIEFCKNDSLVSRARNNLVARAMSRPKTTHLFFVDSDIAWNPVDVVKLLLADKPIVGGVYPIKSYNWDNLSDPKFVETTLATKNASMMRDSVADVDFVRQRMVRYNINFENVSGDGELEIRDNLAEVRHLATGFMMLQRSTIEQMVFAFPDTKYVDDVGFLSPAESEFAYALFDCGVVDGHYYSEDWMFCQRWKTKMGGRVYIDVSIKLIHSGTEDFIGAFLSSLV